MDQTEFFKRMGRRDAGAEQAAASAEVLTEALVQEASKVTIELGRDHEDHLAAPPYDHPRLHAENLPHPRTYPQSFDDDPQLQNAVRELAIQSIDETDAPLSAIEREFLLEKLTAELLGLGPIQPLLSDPAISEIMVNGHDDVWVERAGLVYKVNVRFDDEEHLRRIIERIVNRVGRRIDEGSPMVDARLSDGSRVNAVIPPLALRGSYLTIRRFRDMPLDTKALIEKGTLTPKSARFLELAVAGGANILISGGTGTGKTTTLNVLSAAIPDGERIVTIEDAAELQLNQVHVLPMESRPSNAEGAGRVSIRDLLRNSLRMRPDRIIVGECRGAEAVDMLQAMNTGHDGCMTTIHANTTRDALSRLETLVLTSGIELPARAIREQIASAFDLVVQLERMVDGSRRIVAITEVTGMEAGIVTLQDIYVAKPRAEDDENTGMLRGQLKPTGVIPGFLEKLLIRNVDVPRHVFQEGIGGRTSSADKSATSRRSRTTSR
jgi:pilus assembly protein CpaF